MYDERDSILTMGWMWSSLVQRIRSEILLTFGASVGEIMNPKSPCPLILQSSIPILANHAEAWSALAPYATPKK